MTTKEKILEESLFLFSQKGYSGTTIRDIAKAVKIRESSVYKHFESKQDIMDHIVNEMQNKVYRTFLPEQSETTGFLIEDYECSDIDFVNAFAYKMLRLFIIDPEISAFRKLLMKEQTSNPLMAKLYDNFFISGPLKKQRAIFEHLISIGKAKKGDTRIMALQYYGVIFTLVQLYDCDPRPEAELKELISQHISSIMEIYLVE